MSTAGSTATATGGLAPAASSSATISFCSALVAATRASLSASGPTLPRSRITLTDAGLAAAGGRHQRFGLALGSLREQRAHDLGVSVLHRPDERRGAVEAVLGVGVRPALQQQLDDLGVPVVAGEGEGRAAVGVGGVDVGAGGEQLLDLGHVAGAGGAAQRVAGVVRGERGAGGAEERERQDETEPRESLRQHGVAASLDRSGL